MLYFLSLISKIVNTIIQPSVAMAKYLRQLQRGKGLLQFTVSEASCVVVAWAHCFGCGMKKRIMCEHTVEQIWSSMATGKPWRKCRATGITTYHRLPPSVIWLPSTPPQSFHYLPIVPPTGTQCFSTWGLGGYLSFKS